MNVKISSSTLIGSVELPTAKAVAHRVLIASALSDKPTEIVGALVGKDVKATIDCLKKLGAKFETKGKNIVVTPIFNKTTFLQTPQKKEKEEPLMLNASESGSTLRFLLPLVAALGAKTKFVGEGRLAERPIGQLLQTLTSGGAIANSDKLPLEIGGKLTSGQYYIDGTTSSQFVSGLLLALPLLDGDSNLNVVGTMVSQSYIDITLKVLKDFGIAIERTKNGFFVKGKQLYSSPKVCKVEADFSAAAFFAVGGALCGDVKMYGLDANSVQGDRILISLLQRANATIKMENEVLCVKKSKLKAIDFSAVDCPDLVPILAIALASAEGISHISAVDRLKIKESDRLQETMNMLAAFGIKTAYQNDVLTIFGGKLKGGKVNACNDHRLAMSAAIAAAVAEGETSILGAECIEKSYPLFFKDFANIGGKVDVLL